MKIDSPLIILALTILAAGAAYWSTIENNHQLNRMEKYDTLNIKLSKEIQELSDLNNSIAKRIDTIVTENLTLTEQNFNLTLKANELIEKVEKLTYTSNELISKVDVRTEKTRSHCLYPFCLGLSQFFRCRRIQDRDPGSAEITVAAPLW